MKRTFLRNSCIGFALLLVQPLLAQYSTDNRVILEHMRYSAEKKFNTWDITLGYGPLIMYNDLADYKVFPTHWRFTPQLMVTKQFFPAFAVDAQFIMGDFRAGNHKYYSVGDLMEYSVGLRTYINQMLAMPGPINDHWNFYAKIGLGLTTFRTRVHYTNTDDVVHIGDLNPENADDGYLVLGYDKDDPYKKIARAKELVVPIGVGVQYRINRTFDVGLQSTMHLSLEDKLENVLIGAENDKYWVTAINVAYKIGKKDKRHSRWTYRGYGFNVMGQAKNDPLVSEFKQLEEELKSVKMGRVVKTDSVTISHHTQMIYGNASLVSVFFEQDLTKKIEPESLLDLATLALNMTKNPTWKAHIYGYADDSESAETNLMLSEKRCQRVLYFFTKDLGLDEDRFILMPQGQEGLLPVDGLSPEARQTVNRRVDVVIQKK